MAVYRQSTVKFGLSFSPDHESTWSQLGVIPWCTESQWSWCSTGVMWSNFFVPVATRAAAFWYFEIFRDTTYFVFWTAIQPEIWDVPLRLVDNVTACREQMDWGDSLWTHSYNKPVGDVVCSLWDCAVIGLVHLLKLTRNPAKLTDELIGDVARLVSILYRPILTSIVGEEAF